MQKIIRSSRKTLSIEIDGEGQLIIRAPRRMSGQAIDRFVQSRQDWIERKTEAVRSRPRAVPHELRENEAFMLLGQTYFLAFAGSEEKVHIAGEKLMVPQGECEQMQQKIIAWYKEQARQIFVQRVAFYTQRTGLSCTGIRVTSAKTRWGSCTARNSLNFSWYLAMAPLFAIDAVVVHELCHTVRHDHSKMFWSTVYKWMPDYDGSHRWLNANGRLLRVEFACNNHCYP